MLCLFHCVLLSYVRVFRMLIKCGHCAHDEIYLHTAPMRALYIYMSHVGHNTQFVFIFTRHVIFEAQIYYCVYTSLVTHIDSVI